MGTAGIAYIIALLTLSVILLLPCLLMEYLPFMFDRTAWNTYRKCMNSEAKLHTITDEVIKGEMMHIELYVYEELHYDAYIITTPNKNYFGIIDWESDKVLFTSFWILHAKKLVSKLKGGNK
jgi:hypothetical protein